MIAQLEDLEGDAFTRLICRYLEDTSVRLEELRGALDRGDTSAVSGIAHS